MTSVLKIAIGTALGILLAGTVVAAVAFAILGAGRSKPEPARTQGAPTRSARSAS